MDNKILDYRSRPTLLFTLFLATILSLAGTASAQSQGQRIALVNANIIDGVQDRPIANATIVIEDGKIAEIHTSPTDSPEVETVIDVGGRYVLPGFIDAHTHISSLESAERALQSGVTTLRTAGADSYRDVALNEMVMSGKLPGPEVVAAGTFVQPKLGEDLLADPRFSELPKTVSEEDALRRLVAINIDRGVRVIKTRATERAGTPTTDPRQQVYTEKQLRIIVDEASKSGIPVMAHSHGAEGSAAAVRAGVRSIEHGTYLTEESLRQMKKRGIYLVPTYTTVVDLTEPGGDYDNPVTTIRGLHMLPRMESMLKNAMKHDVKIVASTDSGYGPESINRVAMEAANFVSLGMSHMDAIRSMTSLAAELLMVENHTGQIAEGYDADLVVVERNPLQDIRSLQDAIVVISNGNIVKNRLPFGLEQ